MSSTKRSLWLGVALLGVALAVPLWCGVFSVAPTQAADEEPPPPMKPVVEHPTELDGEGSSEPADELAALPCC